MEEKFRRYVEGKAKPEEADFVINNLLSADKNEESDRLLSSYWKECMEQKTIKPSNRSFIDNVHKRLGTSTNRGFKRRYNLYKAISYVAVSLLLLVTITSIFLAKVQNKDSHESLTQTINTPYGARTSFDLPDGSKVWLNSGSTVVFPSSFKDKRTVQLTGEAFFDVRKTGKPFVVSTEYGNIEVMGTRFNVNAFDEDMFQTTLVSGKVKIVDNKETFLEPGDQYHKENNQEGKVLKVNPEMFISWVDGELIFKNEPFKSVVKKLERWYNVKIVLKDESLEDIRYTGTIRMESFSEVLEVLAITSSINFSFDAATRVITITKTE